VIKKFVRNITSMKKIKRVKYLQYILLAILVISQPDNLLAQRKDPTAKARAAYSAGEFMVAIDLFKEAYNKVGDKQVKSELIFLIAECYRKTNQPSKAELRYKQAIQKEYPNPIIYLRYADALRMDESYEDAMEQYRKYKELVSDDPRGQDGITSCELAMEWMANPSPYIVENMKYFNSRQSDYSPCYANDDYNVVYFSSSREEANGNDLHGATGDNFSDIFQSRMDRKGKWSVPVALEESINSEFEDGTPILNIDYTTMYFTRCQSNKNKNYGCQIYTSSKSGDTWSDAEPIQIADDSIVIAHPAISEDELTLYFVSDMPGGTGGKDIWMVQRDSRGDDWGKASNVEGINTVDDEMFPFVHSDGSLYFSSNGRIGLGGLDIYRATEQDDEIWKIENMKYPINSSADDFGIVFEKEIERGYFSSTRKGRGNDEIYMFLLPPLKFNVIGEVKDDKTDEVLVNAVVKSIGSDGINVETTTGDDGSFRFMLKPNTDYVFVASREGYLNGKERETTKGQEKSNDFRTVIYLSNIRETIELSNSNVFYDFARWDLRPEAMVSLDKLIETLADNPTITIELMSHTDNRGQDEDNNELSQKRAQSVVDYLIERGIAPDRLTAKGYGEGMPKVITKRDNNTNNFLREGAELSETYINSLPATQQEIAHQLNRRTEFRVLRTDYKPSI
jgi:peptidoglycan-associated lipoprotein